MLKHLKGWMDGWMDGWIDGWMDELRFYILFNSISIISGRWEDDIDRMVATEPRLGLQNLQRYSNHGSLDQ